MIAPGYNLKDEELTRYESIRNPMRFRRNVNELLLIVSPIIDFIIESAMKKVKEEGPQPAMTSRPQILEASGPLLQPKTEDLVNLASKLNLNGQHGSNIVPEPVHVPCSTLPNG